VSQGEIELARQLYERLLERTGHVKVWISYAKFELTSETTEDGMNVSLARRVYEKANDCQKNLNDRDSRVLLLEAWRDFEKENGDEDSLEKVLKKMPRRVKKRQKIVSETGETEGWEEVFDYIFPEDELAKPNLKLLAAAKNWKKNMEPTTSAPADSNIDRDDSEEESGSDEEASDENQEKNDE
jgi:crooked neck